MKKFGTPGLTSIGNQKGIEFLPIRNFKDGHDPAAESIKSGLFNIPGGAIEMALGYGTGVVLRKVFDNV